MLIPTFLILYGLVLIGVGAGVRYATRHVGDPQWPWWLLSLAVLALAIEPVTLGIAALGGADPGTTVLRTGGRLLFGLGLLSGVVGLLRFMDDWHDDRERRFMRSIWSTMAEVYLLEPGTGRVIDSNQGRRVPVGTLTVGEPFEERVVSGRKAFEQALRRASDAAAGRESVQVDLRQSDGSMRPVSVSLERTDVMGRPTVALFVQDLTELRRMQRRARTQADIHRLLIESVAEAILVVDGDGVIRYGSPSVVRFVGRDPVGSSVLDLLPDSEADGARSMILAIVGDPEAEAIGVVRTRTFPDGGPYDIEYRLRQVDYPGVGPSCLVSALDVSERVESERRFRARRDVVAELIRTGPVAEGRLKEVSRMVAAAGVEHLPVTRCGVWLVDDENERLVRFISEGLEGGTDIALDLETVEEFRTSLVAGRSLEVADAASDARVAELRGPVLVPLRTSALLAAPVYVGGQLRGVLTCEHTGGERRWSPDESGFVTELSDVLQQTLQARDRRRRDTEKEDLAAQLRMSQRMETVGVLAGGIAHDFNNLLTPILGYAELLQVEAQESGDDPEIAREIVVACQRAAGLVSQLLTFSRHMEQQDRGPVQVRSVVEEVASLIRASLPASIRVDLDLAADLPPVEADATQLHQVVLNMATNAWQAMAQGGGVLSISLAEVALDAGAVARMPGLAEGRYLKLVVADTGEGMSPDVLRRIFEPFFTTKPVGEGTGLGLAVTHGIVTGHGGHVDVETARGEGTRFTVYLPVATGEPEVIRAPVHADPGVNRYDAIVVDDEVAVMQFVSRVLRREGWAVTSFSNAADALAEIEHRLNEGVRLDVVVTDQTMPEYSGLEVAARVHASAPDLPIVLMSGFDAMVTSEGLDEVGVARFLRKPFVGRQLVSAVREALGEPAADTPGHSTSP